MCAMLLLITVKVMQIELPENENDLINEFKEGEEKKTRTSFIH